MTVIGDKLFSLRKCVTEKNIEHSCRFLCVGRSNRHKSSGLRAHSCLRHHFGLVFAKSLRTLESIFLVTKLCKYLALFKLVICKISLISAGYLKEGRFCNKYLSLFDKSREQTVKHREQKRSNLESVLIRIGAYNYLAPL